MKNSFLLELEERLKKTPKRAKRIRLIKEALKSAPDEDTRQVLMVWQMYEENLKETRGNPNYRGKKIDHLKEWLIIALAIRLMKEDSSTYSAKREGANVSDKLKFDVPIFFEKENGVKVSDVTVRRVLEEYSERMIRLGYPAPFRKNL